MEVRTSEACNLSDTIQSSWLFFSRKLIDQVGDERCGSHNDGSSKSSSGVFEAMLLLSLMVTMLSSNARPSMLRTELLLNRTDL